MNLESGVEIIPPGPDTDIVDEEPKAPVLGFIGKT
jgi:hypothetical protein